MHTIALVQSTATRSRFRQYWQHLFFERRTAVFNLHCFTGRSGTALRRRTQRYQFLNTLFQQTQQTQKTLAFEFFLFLFQQKTKKTQFLWFQESSCHRHASHSWTTTWCTQRRRLSMSEPSSVKQSQTSGTWYQKNLVFVSSRHTRRFARMFKNHSGRDASDGTGSFRNGQK